jgi:hypothetical protein
MQGGESSIKAPGVNVEYRAHQTIGSAVTSVADGDYRVVRFRAWVQRDLDQPIRVRRCADLKSGHIDALSRGHRPMGFYSPLCLYKGRNKMALRAFL